MSDLEKADIPYRRCRFGNPAPLCVSFDLTMPSHSSHCPRNVYSGLFSFASTTLVLSLYNVHARHITAPNVIVGMALFFGGLAQFLAGMWEFATGNTFGATGESGTFHSISLHHTQVMAAAAIIKACCMPPHDTMRSIISCFSKHGVFQCRHGCRSVSVAHHGPSLYSGVSLTIYLLWAAFTSYGAFWLSFATLLIPGSGVGDAYGADAGMEFDAIGIYLIAWMIVTFLFL
jgi:succinate-acetate transporter protein